MHVEIRFPPLSSDHSPLLQPCAMFLVRYRPGRLRLAIGIVSNLSDSVISMSYE